MKLLLWFGGIFLVFRLVGGIAIAFDGALRFRVPVDSADIRVDFGVGAGDFIGGFLCIGFALLVASAADIFFVLRQIFVAADGQHLFFVGLFRRVVLRLRVVGGAEAEATK